MGDTVTQPEKFYDIFVLCVFRYSFDFLTCLVDFFIFSLLLNNYSVMVIEWRDETHIFFVHKYIGVYIHKCVYIYILCVQPEMKMIKY